MITNDKASYVAKVDSICLFSVAREAALNEQQIKPPVPFDKRILKLHILFNSYGIIKWGLVNWVDLAWGWSKPGEGLLPTGLPCLVFICDDPIYGSPANKYL